MDTKIFENAYVAMILAFIVSIIIFYPMGIGFVEELDIDGKKRKVFKYNYSIALALIVWLMWTYYLYPPSGGKQTRTSSPQIPTARYNIDMNDW